ncbi:unnamed protein product [Brassica rapa]|uniref:Uncharacterized protein n=1 Tax=Brassica campestris TaxID=3711 RepID=A0A8D9HNC6_BRACM|nr:unnamed protein product [Brassica rapa]
MMALPCLVGVLDLGFYHMSGLLQIRRSSTSCSGSTVSLRADHRACQILLGFVSRIHWVPLFAASRLFQLVEASAVSSGIFAVIFSPPLRVAVASPVPLLVTTHSLRTSRSDETRTRSAHRLIPIEPLSRLFPYPDFYDERSPSTPPTCEASCLAGSGSSISDDSSSHVFILFELCSVA